MLNIVLIYHIQYKTYKIKIVKSYHKNQNISSHMGGKSSSFLEYS